MLAPVHNTNTNTNAIPMCIRVHVWVWHMQLDIGYIDVGKRYSLARLVRHISSQAMTQEESSKQSTHKEGTRNHTPSGIATYPDPCCPFPWQLLPGLVLTISIVLSRTGLLFHRGQCGRPKCFRLTLACLVLSESCEPRQQASVFTSLLIMTCIMIIVYGVSLRRQRVRDAEGLLSPKLRTDLCCSSWVTWTVSFACLQFSRKSFR